jgi:hypothetical protein
MPQGFLPRPFRPAPAPQQTYPPPRATAPARPNPTQPPRVRLQDDTPPSQPARPATREPPLLPPAPPPPPLKIPVPEELGVSARPAVPDWTAGYRRLCELGANCFQMSKLPQGGWRVTCSMPTGQPDRNHRIEAEADSEAEAVRLVLTAAEEWVARKR